MALCVASVPRERLAAGSGCGIADQGDLTATQIIDADNNRPGGESFEQVEFDLQMIRDAVAVGG